MMWYENPTVEREYAEALTGGMKYIIKRKRTKEEILGRPPRNFQAKKTPQVRELIAQAKK